MTSSYGMILRRYVALIAVVGLAGLLVGALWAQRRDAYYEASADVRLSQLASPFRSSDGTRADLSRALETQIDVATGDAVRARLAGTPNGDADVVVAAKGERDELRFTVRADDPRRATNAANAWAESYVAVLKAEADAAVAEYNAALDAASARLTRQIEIVDAQRRTAPASQRPLLDLRRDVLVAQLKALAGRGVLDDVTAPGLLEGDLVRRAQAPSGPANDDLGQLLLLGLGAGLIVGYVAACVLDYRRDLVHGPEEVALVAPHEPVIGPVPSGRDFAALDRLSAGMSYLTLRSEVLAVSPDIRPSVFSVVSVSGETESPAVALGLALALTNQGERVLLLDGETEHAGISDLLPADDSRGLAGVLVDGRPVAESVRTARTRGGAELLLLPAGPLPAGSLASPAFGEVLQQLIGDYRLDAVVISAGAASRSPDATAAALMAHSVFVVATARQTKRRQLALAVRRLQLLAPVARAVVLATVARTAKDAPGEDWPLAEAVTSLREGAGPRAEGLSSSVPRAQ